MSDTARFAAILCVAVLLVRCTTVRTVTVPTVQYRDSIRVEHRHDSVYIRDSIRVQDTGDTVRVDRWRTLYVWRMRVDTVATMRVDTIPVTVEVERAPTVWTRVKLAAFPWLLAIAAVAALYVLIKIWKTFKI